MEEKIKDLYEWINEQYNDFYSDGYPEEANALSMVMREMEKRFPTIL